MPAYDSMNQLVADTRNAGGANVDIQHAKLVELCTGPGGQVWLNVDGMCLARIVRCESVFVDTSNAPDTSKTVRTDQPEGA